MGRYDDLAEAPAPRRGRYDDLAEAPAPRRGRYDDLLPAGPPAPAGGGYGDLLEASGPRPMGALEQSMARSRQDQELLQERKDQVLHTAAGFTRAIPGVGPSLADLFDPTAKEYRGVNPAVQVPMFFSRGGGATWNEATGQPHLEAQTSETLGPATRHAALARGLDLPELAAVPQRDTTTEDVYAQELTGAGRVARPVSPEEARRLAALSRARAAAGNVHLTDAQGHQLGFTEDFATNLGDRAIALGMGAPAASPQANTGRRAQDIANILASEKADVEQSTADRVIQGSRTELPTAYEAAVQSGASPLAGVALEAISDPLTWVDLFTAPLAAGARVVGRAGREGVAVGRDLLTGGFDLGRGAERGLVEGAQDLGQTADITSAASKRLRSSQQVAAERSPGRYADLVEETPSGGLKTAQEAAAARQAEKEALDAEEARLAARRAEFQAQERLAELAPGDKPTLALPEKKAPQPLEVVTQERGNVRETISPARDEEVAARVAEGQARESEILAKRQAELADQPTSSTLELPGQQPAGGGKLILPGEEAAGAAERKLILPESSAENPYARMLGEEPAPPPAGRYADLVEGEVAPAAPGRKVALGEEPGAPKEPRPKPSAEEVDDYINRRAFGEVPESPVYEELQRVNREIADVERERAMVERRGAGQLSREERTANMKQSDQLRKDAERLQARQDALRRTADEDAHQFRQAFRRGEVEIPQNGPASLEQGYAPQGAPAKPLEMGTPQPGPARTPPNQGATVEMPTPQQPAPRKTLGDIIRTALGRREPGQVKNVPELIRGAAKTLDKMTGAKSVYGMGKGSHVRTPARFLSKLNLIEIKRGNMTGFWHEVGHAFDEMAEVVAPWWNKSRTRPEGKFSRRAELAGELDALGATGHSSWQPGMGNLRRRQEGMAEFARTWMENPDEAKRVAPKTYAAFEKHLDEMGDLGAEWRRHQDDLQLRMQSDDAAQAAAHVVERPDQKWRVGTIEETVDGYLDRFNPVKAIDETVADFKGVAKLEAEDSMYVQARLLKNLSNRKIQDFQLALKEALKPINEMGAKASRNFQTWLVARHAVEMERAGLATGVPVHQWEALVQAYDSPEFRKVADDFKQWQQSVNDYAVEHGNLDPLKVEEWNNKWEHYVPTNRELENVIGQMDSKAGFAAGNRGLKAGRGPASWLKRKKGGMQAIYEPIETSLANMQSTVHSTERNRIGKMLAKAYDEDTEGLGQYVREIKPGQRSGRNTITIRDGRPADGTYRERVFEFTSDRFYKAYAALDEKSLGGFVRFFSIPANTLRWGATKISAPFIVNNIQRDTMEAAMNSRRKWAMPLHQSFDGLFTVIRSHLGDAKAKEVVEAFARSGGHQGIDEMYSNPASARKLYRDVLSSLSLTERALSIVPKPVRVGVKGVGDLAGSPFKILTALSDLSEQATRVGEFKLQREALRKLHPTWSEKSIEQQAGFEALDLLDFDLRGNNEIVRAMRSLVPFSGSSMTGTYRNVQAFADNPKLFAAKAFAFLTAPTLLLWSINRNNPYYNEKTQDDKDQNWFIPMPAPIAKALGVDNPAEQFFRIKKPFLLGTLGAAMPERFFSHMFDKDPHAADGLLKAVLSQSTPAGVDDLGGPMMRLVSEVGHNYDSFTGRDIEPEWLRSGPGEVAPYMRSDEYSTITARMLSQAMNKLPIDPGHKLSPMMIDHIIKGVAGAGGQAIVKGEMFGETPILNRYGIDPALHALTGEDEAKASRRQYLGLVPTESRHESENRFFARLSELRQTVNDQSNPDSKKLAGKLKNYEKVAKTLKDLYKKRASAKDETQRMRINRSIVRETERLEPPIPRQKELRQRERDKAPAPPASAPSSPTR